MLYQDLIRKSIEVVLDLEIPDASFGRTVMAQVAAMSGPRGD